METNLKCSGRISESLKREISEDMLQRMMKVQHPLAARDGLNSLKDDLYHIQKIAFPSRQLLGIDVLILYLSEQELYWRYYGKR